MQHKNAIVHLLVLLSFFLGTVAAQESLNASGSEAEGTGGSAAYVVGQTVYHQSNGSNGTVTAGVQQAFEISVVTGLSNKTIQLSMKVFPNPVTDYLTLSILDADFSDLSFQLFDNTAKIIQQETIKAKQTDINMSDLKPNVYFIRIMQKQKTIKTFKVLKN